MNSYDFVYTNCRLLICMRFPTIQTPTMNLSHHMNLETTNLHVELVYSLDLLQIHIANLYGTNSMFELGGRNNMNS
jgi:hypothetical protein